MGTFTYVKLPEVKRRGGLTQASICEAGSIRVYGNTVFTKIGRFKKTSSTDP